MAHIHAELMKQYAEDAAHYDEPWKLWECKDTRASDCWFSIEENPVWYDKVQYRRKLTKPNPLKEKPNNDERYYVISLQRDDIVSEYVWTGDDFDHMMLSRLCAYKTKDDAINCSRWLLEKLKESSNDNN